MKQIGILIPAVLDPLQNELINSVCGTVSKYGYDVLVITNTLMKENSSHFSRNVFIVLPKLLESEFSFSPSITIIKGLLVFSYIRQVNLTAEHDSDDTAFYSQLLQKSGSPRPKPQRILPDLRSIRLPHELFNSQI